MCDSLSTHRIEFNVCLHLFVSTITIEYSWKETSHADFWAFLIHFRGRCKINERSYSVFFFNQKIIYLFLENEETVLEEINDSIIYWIKKCGKVREIARCHKLGDRLRTWKLRDHWKEPFDQRIMLLCTSSRRVWRSFWRFDIHFSRVFCISVEELITLIENVADSVALGQCNPDSMTLLLANLRIHGPQLEDYSKSTLDQGILEGFKGCEESSNILTISAYVKFRNASQDERLSIITRMNLLELIELRAKSWQISDGINTYYKHKASDIQVGSRTCPFE